jgi:hypothetical protein
MTNQNEAQIVARIEALKSDLALNFKQICDLLVLVRNHYLHKEMMFRRYREVASGKLIPEIVWAMDRRRHHLKHMAGRPHELQMKIATDGPLSWCCAVRGEIVEKRTSWKVMKETDFKRMFPIGGPVRSITEQREVLKAEIAAGHSHPAATLGPREPRGPDVHARGADRPAFHSARRAARCWDRGLAKCRLTGRANIRTFQTVATRARQEPTCSGALHFGVCSDGLAQDQPTRARV